VLSFDGSAQEVAVREEYPSSRVGYIQVAGVLVHLDEMLGQAQQLFVDPAVIRGATQESLVSIVVPSTNVCRQDADTVSDSWRMEMFELFRDYEVERRPLLNVYLRLLRAGGRTDSLGDAVILNKCSADDDCAARVIAVQRAGSPCPVCGRMLFPTDALRIHEEVLELNSNLTAIGRLRGILEHLVMVCYLDYLFERQPRVLSSVAFILDGPLAIFGPQAPLKRAILAYLQSLSQDLQSRGYKLPLIVGLEKGGQFSEHGAQIAKHLPNGTLMRLPDDYIFQRILTSRSSAASGFGEDTYYGRKFFYKSVHGQMFTLTIPCLDVPRLQQYRADDPACYSTLPSTVALLDEIGTKIYEDAVIPVALAHSFAAIPLNMGSRVLTLLSRGMLGEGS
jgi:hypothetical protein